MVYPTFFILIFAFQLTQIQSQVCYNNACTVCSNSTETGCNSCQIGYNLVNGNCISISSCIDGYYLKSDNSCQICNGPCKTCILTSLNCTSCLSPLILRNHPNGIFTCCESGKFVDSIGECKDCESNCLTCIGASNDCQSCDITKSLILKYANGNGKCCLLNQYVDSAKNCINCNINCKTCNITTKNCLSCNNNMVLMTKSDNTNICCESAQYVDASGVCQNCYSSCLTCFGTADNCKSCNLGYSLMTPYGVGRCCLSNKFVDSSNNCQICDSNCKTCETTAISCLTCYGNYIIDAQNKCVCPSYQYLDIISNVCTNCNPNCLTCSMTSTNCNSCVGTNILMNFNDNGRCCMSNEYIDNGYNCQICNQNCKTCNISATNCSSCAATNTLMQINDNGRCCMSNEYIDNGYNCQICNQNCKTCSITSTNCRSCYGNLILDPLKRNCVCLSNQYLDLSGSFCINCDSNCLTCLKNSTNCESCTSMYILEKNDDIGKCVCPSYQYFNISTNSCNNCDSSCSSCTDYSPFKCIQCSPGYSLYNETCLSICNNSQYFDSITNICKQCNDLCQTCDGPLYNNCLTCENAKYLKSKACVASCTNFEFTDQNNNICSPCDASCLKCSGIANTSCTLCPDHYFLLKSVCYEICPDGYYENFSSKSCELKHNLQMSLSDIDNPYKFLLVFYSTHTLSITFKNNLRMVEEILLNSSIKIMDNRPFTYSITPSIINSSVFILKIDYLNGNLSFNTSSLMTVSILGDNSYFDTISNSVSIELLKAHLCDQVLEYFDANTTECVKKHINDFSWSYGDKSNVILLNFNDLNQQIKSAIFSKLFLIINIDGFKYHKDYSYDFLNSSNIISINFTYQKSVIGGVMFHLSLNQSIYKLINYQNQTSHLMDYNYDIKLQEYYFLSENQKKNINNTIFLTKSGAQTSNAAVSINMFITPGSSFAIRGLILMNIVQLLKYIDIAYPPNVVEIFKNDDNRLFFKTAIFDDSKEKIPQTFRLYKVFCSFLNNSIEELFQFGILLILALLFCFVLNYPDLWKRNTMLKILILIARTTFIWSLMIMLLISKYMKVAVFIFIFFRYKMYPLEFIADFIFSLVCLFYVTYLPFHLFLIIKKMQIFQEVETNNRINISATNDLPIVTSNKTFFSNIFDEKKKKICESPPFNSEKIFPCNFDDNVQNISNGNVKIINLKNTLEISPKNFPANLKSKKNKIPFVEWGQVSYINPDNPYQIDKIFSIDLDCNNKLNKNNIEIFEESEKKSRDSAQIILDNDEIFFKENETLDFPKKNQIRLYDRKKEVAPSKFTKKIFPTDLLEKNTNFETINVRRNFYKVIVGLVKFPFSLISNIVYKIYNPESIKEFSFRYRILLKGLHNRKLLNKYYFIADIIRYLSLALVVTLLFEYPLTQIIILEIICFAFLIYIVLMRPFQAKIDMCICLINETLINNAFISAALLAWFDRSEIVDLDLRMNLGWSIAFTYLILMYSLIFNTFQRTVRLLIFIFKKIYQKFKTKK